MERALRVGFKPFVPLRLPADPLRVILVKSDIADTLEGKGAVGLGFPHMMADRVVGIFVAGQLVAVSRKSAEGVDLEQLEGLDDVWAMCFRRPKPGWRLLGRFLERDVLVGLRLYERHYLADRKHYNVIARQIPQAWTEELGGLAPIRSADLSAYLSGVYRDVDQED